MEKMYTWGSKGSRTDLLMLVTVPPCIVRLPPQGIAQPAAAAAAREPPQPPGVDPPAGHAAASWRRRRGRAGRRRPGHGDHVDRRFCRGPPGDVGRRLGIWRRRPDLVSSVRLAGPPDGGGVCGIGQRRRRRGSRCWVWQRRRDKGWQTLCLFITHTVGAIGL